MKKVFLLTLISLTGCETYIPAQDVYYDDSPAVVYTQPVAVYEQPEVTYIQQSATPQTVYISQQPTTSVIYVEEPVYYVPAPMPAPQPIPPHHFGPRPPHRPHAPAMQPIPNPPHDMRPPHQAVEPNAIGLPKHK